ncbi:MAG: CobW family GTP-binding protein [Pseudomonadota bacterium]
MPVTLIGGYLGAGKTTLVNQSLRQAAGKRLAVLVNEFGELPIDEDLIEAQDDDLISIAGGCICCSFGSDLTAAMMKLADLDPRPDHILIESSGVAMPGAIAQSILLLPQFEIQGVCVLADCMNVWALSRDEYVGDTIARQLSEANLIILTKTDLASEEQRLEVERWLAAQWPQAAQVTALRGHVPKAILLGDFSISHPFDLSIHDDQAYDSIVLNPDRPLDVEAFAQRLVASSSGVLRAKGYVMDISGRIGLIQIVGTSVDVSFPETPGTLGVVCIGLRSRLLKARLLSFVTRAHVAHS